MGLFATKETREVTLRTGERLKCQVCGGERFHPRNVMLGPFWFWDLACFACERCGHVHFFRGHMKQR